MGYQNIYLPVDHLRRINSIAPGGFCYALFAKWESVNNWPEIDPLTGICNTAITLKTGETWYELQLANNLKLYQEVQKTANAGDFISIVISGYLGGSSVNHSLSIRTMVYSNYVIMMEDRDGIIRLIGDQDSGPTLKYTRTSGDIQASRKRPLEFDWETPAGTIIYQLPE